MINLVGTSVCIFLSEWGENSPPPPLSSEAQKMGGIFLRNGGIIFRNSLKRPLFPSFWQPAAGAARKMTFLNVSNPVLNEKPRNSTKIQFRISNIGGKFSPHCTFGPQKMGEIFPPFPPNGGKIITLASTQRSDARYRQQSMRCIASCLYPLG